MAVQKSRRSRSTRGMRRGHDKDKVFVATLSTDKETGELHRRHHMTRNGFYRGRQVVELKTASNDESKE